MVDYQHGAAVASTLPYPLFPAIFTNGPLDQHQNTMFVGFDIAEIQPRLRDFEHFNDISDRINWVNGNLYGVRYSPYLQLTKSSIPQSRCLPISRRPLRLCARV